MRRLIVRNPVSYPILIGEGVLEEVRTPEGPSVLLYDRRVEGFALKLAERLGVQHQLGLEGGEGAKTLAVYGRVLSFLAEKGLPRNTTLLVVGGGTLTDLGGFVAATYLRGIPYLSFPTTTLSVVDASVGGKTGINLPEGKNLVGAFHFPQGVYAELEALKTLPPFTFKEGLVEAFKHGIISGEEGLLEVEDLTPESPRLEAYLAQAVAVKVRITEQDPTEKGERRLLNLGHTLGHALEAYTHHALPHGAAVAYGLLYAALLGKLLGGEDLTPLVLRLLRWLSPPPLPRVSWEDLLPYLLRDKKKVSESLHWVVPLGLGNLTVKPLPETTLREAFGLWREVLSTL
ncbi:3-dehydroquinate synthase [Thermus scotoductus]|uniref:3-dehydroquinate synthase n=1 Tax=Thermus scotoductus TaxID=37636 RepID=A0A430SCP1_THESC|nr:3-dehydroquinate synthase family protein [Thermus scotoductus]RTG98217.1 3-dehydroquinate synthase [Thermus scotoductus]RTH11497.1 3-dehydroquinate synthase [Thermus scotoductus]RTH12946.1 3-dehydroquinate synthase [Thermus scotoductus]RTH14400.1 3-dehydroquinate synthase [Thermus scotoductus]RTH14499.1 3-dehydroquinate synthase [Thermus scotoductus]